MSIKNSYASVANQINKLNNNAIATLGKLHEVVSSNENEIIVEVTNSDGGKENVSFPTVGWLSSEIERLNQNINTLSSVDQRGSVIQPSRNSYAKIIRVDLNREPNPIPELDSISTFQTEKNWFFDSILNPMLKVRLDLTDKIEDNVRKIVSRRYIIKFELDETGNPTDTGQAAIDNYNENFKGRTDITIEELEDWLNNTPGIATNNQSSKITCDEQEFDLEPNMLQYEGFFTVLGVDEDTVNKKQFYLFDTLDYFEVSTKEKRQLQIGDNLIINNEFSSTRYQVVEINNEASEIRVRLTIVEGYEAIPVGIVGGVKYYSPIVENKQVDVSIGYDEYNVIFTKAINTETNLIGRKWSTGVAFYSNDLTLNSSDNTGDNGKSMEEYYISTVRDFGTLLRDLVERNIPRINGIVPNSVVLSDDNFRVLQTNKYLTETTSLEEARTKNTQILALRSKLEQTTKTIQEKTKELYGKKFKTPKDKQDVENQIKKLKDQASSDTELLNTTVQELLSNNANNSTVDPEYRVQGFWQIPVPQDSSKTRPQEVIAFKIQYKYSNIDGKESENETFKVIDDDGNETNAVFSPWETYTTEPRERVFDVEQQKFVWLDENLSSIDEPNINSINLKLDPNAQITIRVKAISEVGYPDSLLESEWSNEITISFPDELLQGRNPQEQFLKNAELEDLRNKTLSDLDRKGLSEHLEDGVTFENSYFPHISKNVGYTDPQGRIISLDEKIKQLENASPVEQPKNIELLTNWVNYGSEYSNASYYKHEGRVYLGGLIRIDKGEEFKSFKERFIVEDIRTHSKSNQNTSLSVLGFLPENYRPNNRVILTSSCSSTTSGDVQHARIDILPTGAITIVNGNTGWLSLDDISFRASE